MPANRTIYVDMDDVICETCRGFIELLRSEFDRRVAFADVRVFDLRESFAMSDDELETFMERAHWPDVLAALEPLPGALETLRTWVDDDYGIAVMTGRPPTTQAVTEAWLARYEVPYGSLDFVDKYGRGGIDASFGEALTLDDLAARRFCLAVEDSAATATFLAEREVAPVVLIDRPWNRNGVGGGVRRVSGWPELARVGLPAGDQPNRAR